MFLLCMMLLTVAPDEPNALRPLHVNDINEPPPSDLPRTPASRGLGFVLVPKIGAIAGLTGPLKAGVAGALEFGYRAPFWHRLLGISLELTLQSAIGSDATEAGPSQSHSLFVGGTPLLTLNLDSKVGLFRVLVGPSFSYSEISVETGGVRADNTGVSTGVTAGLAYLFYIGPGGLGLEVRYLLLPYGASDGVVMAHSLTVQAAYAFFF